MGALPEVYEGAEIGWRVAVESKQTNESGGYVFVRDSIMARPVAVAARTM